MIAYSSALKILPPQVWQHVTTVWTTLSGRDTVNVIQVNSHEALRSVLQVRTKTRDTLPVRDLHGQASTVGGSVLQSIPHTGKYLAATGKRENGCGLCT